MKRLTALFFLISLALQAQDKINFREGKLPDILKIAQTENKPLFYMGYATWCVHCNKMKKEVVTDKSVADFFNANFTCMWQDLESADGAPIKKQYNIKGFPAFLFFNAKGELLYSTSGEMTAAEFIAEGKKALDEKNQFPYLKKQYESDPNNPDVCYAYLSALRRSNFPTDDIAKKYFSKIPDAKMATETNWRIIANGIRDIDSREFQYVLKNQDAFAKVSSPKRVQRKIVNMVQEWLEPSVENTDTITYFKKRPSVAAIAMPKTDSLVFIYDLKILESAKNWKSYSKYAKAGVPKIAWNNASQLKDIAVDYMNNIDDKKALGDAIDWAKRSLEIKDDYATQIAVARLYLKKGDKTSAKEWAEKARNVAVGYKWDTKQADAVLEQIK